MTAETRLITGNTEMIAFSVPCDVGVLVLTGECRAWSGGMDFKEYFRETEAHGLGAVRKAW